MEKNPGFNFSYSGLKTSVLYLIKKLTDDNKKLSKKQIIDIAACFERVATEHLCQRLNRVLKSHQVSGILLGGGVVCNQYIRSKIRQMARKYSLPMFWPGTKKLCNDNAAMICVAAFYKAKRKEFVKDIDRLDRNPIMSL